MGSDALINHEYNIFNDFTLNAPFPNPFNPSIYFEIELNSRENVNISIYDMKGSKIDEIYSGFLNQGEYEFMWNANRYVSGIYMIKVETSYGMKTKKISLVK